MLKMAILTLVAPLVAMMYPLDKKGGGKARGFDFWLKEYIYTALLQPVHLLLYNLLIGTAVQISVKNPIYAIIALFFMANAEKMFKKIFGFGRAGKGMENGLERKLTYNIITRPYIDLILCTMSDFRAEAEWVGSDTIKVVRNPYSPRPFSIENG